MAEVCTCGHIYARHNIAKKPGELYCMKEYCACANFVALSD